MKKRMFALFLVLAMLVTLVAGCGSKTETTPTQSEKTDAPAQPDTSKDQVAEETTPADDEPVELSVILITGYEFFEDVINQYTTEHPNVSVDVQIMPTTDYKTLIKTKFAADDAPDVLPVFCEADYYEYYRNGYLSDVSDMTDTLNRLNDGAVTSFQVDGGVLGIPYTQEYLLCYYNKDMFSANNLEIPTTWEEMLDICAVLKDQGTTPIALGHKDAWVELMLTYSMNATTVQYADPTFYDGTMDGTNKFADNAGWLETLTKYDELVKLQYINEGSLSTSAEQMYEMFVNQEAAMFFGGTWCDQSVAELNPEFEVGGFQIPAPGGSKAVAVSISGGMGVNARSEHEEEAKALLAYMLSKDALETYGNNMATCFSDVQTNLSTALQEGLEALNGLPCYQYDDTHFASGLQMVMCSAIQEMIAGSKTPMEVLQTMDDATAKANR